VWTVQGAGSDIWSTADHFHFASQTLPGDGSVSARVISQSKTNAWAKAGVMLRQGSDQSALYYAVFVTPSNGIVVQYRSLSGGSTRQIAIAGTTPTYLKVGRSGTTYTAYTSADGVSWTRVPRSSVSLSTPGPVQGGLAVTSHNTGVFSTVTFDAILLAFQ
jgi:hypothetical protein